MWSESGNSSSQPVSKGSDVESSKPQQNTNDIKDNARVNGIQRPTKAYDGEHPKASDDQPSLTTQTNSSQDSPPFVLSPGGMSSSGRNLNFPQPVSASIDSNTGNDGTSAFARITSGLGLRFQSMTQPTDEIESTTKQAVLESFKNGILNSSRSAVKAVQVKARNIVSRNKIRFQEGEFDLDMTYITENIIAMGFPAGDLSSGIFGFFEGFYRNHMEEVIKFFETRHQGRYKVYNLCSERLYDASLFQGKVANYPFDDQNCPPLDLIKYFCQSAYSWLKDDIENVVAVHCKAGLGRTGLMICCLLLFLKFFTTAEEAIAYFNQKRCMDGKALVLPSQIRYVKYFKHILTHFRGENQPGRRCMLRGFRLISCPYWIRPSITISDHSGMLFSTRKHPKTKDLRPEDFWIKARNKRLFVFALPGEPGLTELAGDFKIHFHDSQGDFYCWLNTTMIQNRTTLAPSDLDGFEKTNVPYPGFKIELVMIDYNAKADTNANATSSKKGDERKGVSSNSKQSKVFGSEDHDTVFSDSDGEESGSSMTSQIRVTSAAAGRHSNSRTQQKWMLTHGAHQTSVKSQKHASYNASADVSNTGVGKTYSGILNLDSMGPSDIKAMAADVSVFSFGDEEDSEGE